MRMTNRFQHLPGEHVFEVLSGLHRRWRCYECESSIRTLNTPVGSGKPVLELVRALGLSGHPLEITEVAYDYRCYCNARKTVERRTHLCA